MNRDLLKLFSRTSPFIVSGGDNPSISETTNHLLKSTVNDREELDNYVFGLSKINARSFDPKYIGNVIRNIPTVPNTQPTINHEEYFFTHPYELILPEALVRDVSDDSSAVEYNAAVVLGCQKLLEDIDLNQGLWTLGLFRSNYSVVLAGVANHREFMKYIYGQMGLVPEHALKNMIVLSFVDRIAQTLLMMSKNYNG